MIVGPLLITVADFWQLVWQEQVKIIAMVTNIKEHGTKKCEAYWPEGGGKSWFGNIQVTLEEERIYADYVIRTLQIHVCLFNYIIIDRYYIITISKIVHS